MRTFERDAVVPPHRCVIIQQSPKHAPFAHPRPLASRAHGTPVPPPTAAGTPERSDRWSPNTPTPRRRDGRAGAEDTGRRRIRRGQDHPGGRGGPRGHQAPGGLLPRRGPLRAPADPVRRRGQPLRGSPEPRHGGRLPRARPGRRNARRAVRRTRARLGEGGAGPARRVRRTRAHRPAARLGGTTAGSGLAPLFLGHLPPLGPRPPCPAPGRGEGWREGPPARRERHTGQTTGKTRGRHTTWRRTRDSAGCWTT